MAIDGGRRNSLTAGTRLVASYRKQQHTAEVVDGEDGKLRFRLADGREFTSPSAAASAVMGGVAANGWRFWSLDSDEAEAKPAKEPAKPSGKSSRAAKKTKPDATATEPTDAQQAEPVAVEGVTND
jgi:hypothetical protein